MSVIHPYLTFAGNCREAMNFYRDCLGGELFFQTIGESPMAEKMPEKMRGMILHASLTNGALNLLGSDMVPDAGLKKGNSVSLSLMCGSEEEVRSVYQKLSEEGQPTHPLEVTFFGAILGGLTDKYGNNWLLYYEKA
jgi:PhnB protein